MKNKSCICCVVDESPVFKYEFLIWTMCLHKYIDSNRFDFKVYFINNVPKDLNEFAKAHNVEVVVVEPFSLESPHCNKILPYLDQQNATYDHVIVTDSDLYIVEDFSTFLNEHDIRLAPNNNNNPPISVFHSVFSELGIEGQLRGGVSLFKGKNGSRESYLNNNSGGITILPKKYFPIFGEQWKKWALFLIENRSLLGQWKVHVDQVSMAIFLEKNQIDINFLPPQLNCVLGFLKEIHHVKAFHIAKQHREYFSVFFEEDGTLNSNKFSPYLARSIKSLNTAIREVNELVTQLPSLATYHLTKDTKMMSWSGISQIFDMGEEPVIEEEIKISKSEQDELNAIRSSVKEQKSFIAKSMQFNSEFYLKQYPDVKKYKHGALTHFMKFGVKEGRNPNAYFNTFSYRGHYKEVGKSNLNPFYHYLKLGIKKGYNPNPKKMDIYIPYEQTLQESEVSFFEPKQTEITVKPNIRAICFYLPQFHEIEENNKWWGKGYTEWTHVRSGIPAFRGHHQPRIPMDEIGYYNLLTPGEIDRQAKMAKKAGIEGFAFYHYAFSDKRILEKPMEILYNSKDIDLPYCIFWANHPWTKTWYGQEREVLKSIDYNKEFYLQFIKDIEKYLKDDRYIKIDGKPLIQILHHKGPDGPPTFEESLTMTDIWREHAMKSGIGEIHISFSQFDYAPDIRRSIFGLGYDSAFEFCPTGEITGGLTNVVSRMPFSNNFTGKIFQYDAMVEKRKSFHKEVQHKLFPCITTSWDNTARYGNKATFFVGANPNKFQDWFDNNIEYLVKNFKEEERIVFINGWNEWSEGSYLEPDKKYGYAYLNTIQRSLQKATKLNS